MPIGQVGHGQVACRHSQAGMRGHERAFEQLPKQLIPTIYSCIMGSCFPLTPCRDHATLTLGSLGSAWGQFHTLRQEARLGQCLRSTEQQRVRRSNGSTGCSCYPAHTVGLQIHVPKAKETVRPGATNLPRRLGSGAGGPRASPRAHPSPVCSRSVWRVGVGACDPWVLPCPCFKKVGSLGAGHPGMRFSVACRACGKRGEGLQDL